MKGVAILILGVLLVVQSTEAGIRSRVSSDRDRSQRSSYNTQTSGIQNPKNLKSSSESVRKGSAISAWGIIGLILAAIIITTTGYYAFVFYPYLCKKERNYDMIELTNVV
ncbi:uncharacterized protein LOC107036147 [Diachasma alloeum]|uniref:uncharacterized protein LOC107036147 n=1 Tax=Diachasma alloeum TaxID=454923 RepID=UPI0007382276|nr:uncharacterized protein LOC107036147 [Diachasma alloeum]